MRLGFAFLFPLVLIASMFGCKRPDPSAVSTTWIDYKNPLITKASLYDTLPVKSKGLIIKEINGVKVVYTSGKATHYFEYEADVNKVLEMINKLPFKKCNSVTDTTYRFMETSFSLSARSLVSEEEVRAANFFWESVPADYAHYECIKSADRHTILVNRITGRILHRIETGTKS